MPHSRAPARLRAGLGSRHRGHARRRPAQADDPGIDGVRLQGSAAGHPAQREAGVRRRAGQCSLGFGGVECRGASDVSGGNTAVCAQRPVLVVRAVRRPQYVWPGKGVSLRSILTQGTFMRSSSFLESARQDRILQFHAQKPTRVKAKATRAAVKRSTRRRETPRPPSAGAFLPRLAGMQHRASSRRRCYETLHRHADWFHSVASSGCGQPMPRMPPLVAVLMICKRAARNRAETIVGVAGNGSCCGVPCAAERDSGMTAGMWKAAGNMHARHGTAPEPTTTNRKKPSMMGPTPRALPLCTNQGRP